MELKKQKKGCMLFISPINTQYNFCRQVALNLPTTLKLHAGCLCGLVVSAGGV